MVKLKEDNIRIIRSSSHNPWYNLAYEEYLLNNINDSRLIILFYQNKNAIIIGRNQNPWHECSYTKFKNGGGLIARRFSGGGTVFHDLGNLNYSFIVNKRNYDVNKNLSLIQRVLEKFNIKTEVTERHDIHINGYKISGNAFHLKKNRACHHGTLLFNSDLVKISRFLKSEVKILEGNYIKSNPSPVMNISSVSKKISIDDFIKAVVLLKCDNNFNENYCLINPEEFNLINDIYKKNASWNWIYGRTPDFTTIINHKIINLKIKIEKGYIKNCKAKIIHNDVPIKKKNISNFEKYLTDKKFIPQVIKETIDDFLTLKANWPARG
ncbi:MAG: lipoate--protein ligase family protein [Bacillota bacterium]